MYTPALCGLLVAVGLGACGVNQGALDPHAPKRGASQATGDVDFVLIEITAIRDAEDRIGPERYCLRLADRPQIRACRNRAYGWSLGHYYWLEASGAQEVTVDFFEPRDEYARGQQLPFFEKQVDRCTFSLSGQPGAQTLRDSCQIELEVSVVPVTSFEINLHHRFDDRSDGAYTLETPDGAREWTNHPNLFDTRPLVNTAHRDFDSMSFDIPHAWLYGQYRLKQDGQTHCEFSISAGDIHTTSNANNGGISAVQTDACEAYIGASVEVINTRLSHALHR